MRRKRGAYEAIVASTPPEEVWTSPYSIQVNDGEETPVRNALQVGNVNDTVRKYDIGVFFLKQGDNTVTFRVKDRRSYGDYVLYLDRLSFRKLPAGVRSVETAAPLNVFEAGGAGSTVRESAGAGWPFGVRKRYRNRLLAGDRIR
ncbi:hypothetical protein [Cohnella rhizosphaerae]|uniref:Uncharacterized protein n=1 Tax=Cohnella rhizosphaerae TaxID=1457232 RepID=A0A9X4KQM5_9BACL|nr:hypothetical protein [Cohnella rhizosphaerae]MDG0809100.1 hypothetical protein [Cohnella rhizosphaerae]